MTPLPTKRLSLTRAKLPPATAIGPGGETVRKPVRIGDGAHIGPGTLVTFDIPAGASVLWDRPRATRDGANSAEDKT